ncbi:MAG TPA: nucleotidyltransferase family protein [Afifellaceae bacterium]|nr:nucleotidyltransferase family protein [Afifellaceae bacterium]
MPASETELEALLLGCIQASARVMQVLEAARAADLPDWRLFAGALYQTVWNALTGRPADFGINDYDLAYFDIDVSQEAQTHRRLQVLDRIPADLRAKVEVINQARVHVWFETEFGRPYPALAQTDDMLRQALSTAHAVAVRLEADGRLTVAAPFGLADIFNMVLRPNPELLSDPQSILAHEQKALDAQKRWPEITIV